MIPDIAEQARVALRLHVLEPLLPRCLDEEYGGFLVDFDERWRPTEPHEKTLEHAARATIAFAVIEREMPGSGCAELVRHGCAFLKDVMWDPVHGGFFARVDRAGKPMWDGVKHPHAVTYAARAFLVAEPFLCGSEARLWAQRALAWLDEVAWDRTHGGYWGSFRRNNEPYAPGERLATPDGRDILGNTPGFKEINTLGDAMEMLTTFVEHGEIACAERLEWLIGLVVDRLTDRAGILPYLYWPDWRLVPDVVRIGQQFQMIHRLIAAAHVIREVLPLRRCCELTDFALNSARHPEGGFCVAVSGDGRTWPSTGPSTDSRQWWVQLEAVRVFHVLAMQTGLEHDTRARYLQARDEQWDFLREHYFDNQHGGILELPFSADQETLQRVPRWLRPRVPAPKVRPKTHAWKDPMHETEAFLTLMNTESVAAPTGEAIRRVFTPTS